MPETWKSSHERIQAALVDAGKRNALALDLGISESQLSKLLNGQLSTFCHLLDALGLSVHETSYVRSLRAVLRDELGKDSG